MLFLNYFLIICIIVCSFFVIFSKNAVYSVYFLILVFCFSSIIFIILGAEFLAIVLIIVYVGAVSILFLFVVMLLNLRITELHTIFFTYLPIGFFVGFFFFLELCFIIMQDLNYFYLESNVFFDNFRYDFLSLYSYKSQTAYLGFILYNYYGYLVIVASIILLLSMFGVIMLTVDRNYRPALKKELYIIKYRNIKPITFWNVYNKKKI